MLLKSCSKIQGWQPSIEGERRVDKGKRGGGEEELGEKIVGI